MRRMYFILWESNFAYLPKLAAFPNELEKCLASGVSKSPTSSSSYAVKRTEVQIFTVNQKDGSAGS